MTMITQKVPIYSIGSPDPRRFVKGKEVEMNMTIPQKSFFQRLSKLFSFKKTVVFKPMVTTISQPSYTISPTDTKASFTRKDGLWEVLPELMKIRIHEYRNDKPKCIHGELVFCLFDHDPSLALADNFDIVLKSYDSNGGLLANCYIYRAEIVEKHWQMNIEDLITEIHVMFAAEETTSWLRVSK